MRAGIRYRAVAAAALVVAIGSAATGSSAAASLLPPLPQILPIPQVGPLAPGGSNHPGGSGSRPLPSCGTFRRADLGLIHVRARRVRIAPVRDRFRANMFGIAAGGLIQKTQCAPLVRELNDAVRVHARWLRIDINWAQVQDGGRSRYDWRAIDRVVKQATERRMHVLGGIVYTPWWARPLGTYATYRPDPSTYAAFARAAARHYGRLGVRAYEIWNEPNSSTFWQPAADPAAYTAVLKAAYAAIKRVEPAATVLSGGLAPERTAAGNYAPTDFLQGIYANGGRRYFNAVADHPYCWPLFPGVKVSDSAWYQMYGTRPSLRSEMVANGDGRKKIWATEFGAPTGGPIGSFVTGREQARMVVRAYKLFAGYRWAGPLFVYQARDLGTSTETAQNFFGLVRLDFSPKPAYSGYLAASAAVRRATRR